MNWNSFWWGVVAGALASYALAVVLVFLIPWMVTG